MKRAIPWVLLALVVAAFAWIARDRGSTKAELRAVQDSVALVAAQERQVRAALEAELVREARAAAAAREREERAERRARVSGAALREHLAGDTVGLAKLDLLEADHALYRVAVDDERAAWEAQRAAYAELLASAHRELGAARRENEALTNRVEELERERGPALSCTGGYGVTLGGNGPGAVCGVELVRLPLKKVWSAIPKPW